MAMSPEQMRELLRELQASQQLASEKLQAIQEKSTKENQMQAAQAAETANKALMESMKLFITENTKNNSQPSKKENNHSQRLDLRNFQKVDKLTGGENQ